MDLELIERIWERDKGICQSCKKALFEDPYKTVEEELSSLKEIPIFKWSKKCWKCQKETQIVSYVFTVGYSFHLGDIEKLDEALAKKYSFVRQTFSKTLDGEVIANTCIHCGSLQGNWFILEDLIEMDGGPNGENMDQLIDTVLPNNLRPEDLGFEKEEPNPFWSRTTSSGHIHHKDGNPENNSLSNLVLLCADCHAKVHRGRARSDSVSYYTREKRRRKKRVHERKKAKEKLQANKWRKNYYAKKTVVEQETHPGQRLLFEDE